MRKSIIVKKLLTFCGVLGLLVCLMMLFSINAAAVSITSYGTDLNRPGSNAKELIKNGNFENDSGASWNTNTFLGTNLFVTEDSTAPDGSKVLCYKNTSSTPTWHTFSVSVSKDTAYTFSVWVKTPNLSATNKAKASIGIIDPTTGQFAIYNDDDYKDHVSSGTEQIRSTATDNKWHLRSVNFNSGSDTTVTIGIYGYTSEMYFDSMSLFADKYKYLGIFSRDAGEKFTGERQSAVASKTTSVSNKYCEVEDNLIPDYPMNEEASETFWTTESSGWRNGFMSFAESGDEHGTVMKYSSVNAIKLNYFKWLEVEPNTSYTLSFDYKITKKGSGSIKLVDNNIKLPVSFGSVSFNTNPDGWKTYAITFNPGVHPQIGFVIQDAGGEVLIDDIRLFKTSDGIADEPEEPEVVLDPTLDPVPAGTSSMEMQGDTLGLAFRFTLTGMGIAKDEKHNLVLTDAKVDAFENGDEYKLVAIGAVMTNDGSIGIDEEQFTLTSVNERTIIDIPIQYLMECDETGCEYAVRIINIPKEHGKTTIYARPYYQFKYKDKTITVYGSVVSGVAVENIIFNDETLEWD